MNEEPKTAWDHLLKLTNKIMEDCVTRLNYSIPSDLLSHELRIENTVHEFKVP